MSPTVSSWAAISPTASGAAFTATENGWVAVRPPGSRAVTVTVALPAPTPVTDTTLPATEALATPASELLAA